jgi:uncharacterized protein (DUF1697 family)
MPRYVAFLRAINVGGHIVKMDRLRVAFETLGFSAVDTFIASGNVLFTASSKSAPAIERRIAGHLREVLGYDVGTFVRTEAEVAQIAAHDPFAAAAATPYHAIYISFLPGAPAAAARRAVEALASNEHVFHIHDRELYWLSRTPTSESAVSGALLERTLGMPATARNVTTVKKIAAKCALRGK